MTYYVLTCSECGESHETENSPEGAAKMLCPHCGKWSEIDYWEHDKPEDGDGTVSSGGENDGDSDDRFDCGV